MSTISQIIQCTNFSFFLGRFLGNSTAIQQTRYIVCYKKEPKGNFNNRLYYRTTLVEAYKDAVRLRTVHPYRWMVIIEEVNLVSFFGFGQVVKRIREHVITLNEAD